MRWRISSRALLVKVRQRIEAGSKPFLISRPVRSVRVLVFPEPGPARVRMRPWTCEATCSCSALSFIARRPEEAGRYEVKPNEATADFLACCSCDACVPVAHLTAHV